jgi:hypothetical protein
VRVKERGHNERESECVRACAWVCECVFMCACVRVRVHDVNLHCCHETRIIYVSVTHCLYILYEVETVKKLRSSFYLNLDIIIKNVLK